MEEMIACSNFVAVRTCKCPCSSKKMIRNQSVVVERKVFQVKSEDCNGGTWISITERSRGFCGFFRFWRGGDGLVSGAVRESCGFGGFQGFRSKNEGARLGLI
ncbi:hypothetical protein CK203_069288 [Vitis vinifera]|uniref:Uncharacterized protein n=1 Tax=Vitis vinifera TaxID=29760 RepID=A0A438C389_VITVI|nr:hypothetical protein CK203_069288 [Vitis vinifera]